MNRFMAQSFARHAWRTTIMMVFCLLAASPRAGAANIVDIPMEANADASIRLTPVCDVWDGFGFLPVAVHVENHATRARTWNIGFDVGAFYGGGLLSHASFSFIVPPGGTTDSVVFVPGGGSNTNNYTAQMRVSASGHGVQSAGRIFMMQGRQKNFNHAAVSPKLEAAVRKWAPDTGNQAPFQVAVATPADWPADWRVWTPFDRVVLTTDEFDALDAARRNSLREWVAQGGLLVLYPTRDGRGSEEHVNLGLGLVVTAKRPLGVESGPLITRFEAGGNRLAPWIAVAPLLSDADSKVLAVSGGRGGLILFLLVFGILIGPVNLYVFAPAAKRQRLFFTVPAISLGASLLLVGFIVLKDGFGGEGTRRSLVLLLPGENKAVVCQQQVSRTGLLLGHGMTVSADTLLAKEVTEFRASLPTFELTREGDHADGDWFTSRARQVQQLRSITPTRARIELAPAAGPDAPPVVQSSFTTVLRDFVYVDGKGAAWTAAEVPPGRRVELVRRGKLESHPSRIERSGWFYASGGPSELAPLATLASIRWTQDTIFYTGRVEAAFTP